MPLTTPAKMIKEIITKKVETFINPFCFIILVFFTLLIFLCLTLFFKIFQLPTQFNCQIEKLRKAAKVTQII